MKKNDSDHFTRPSDDESIEATAAAWLAQRDDGLSPEEAEAFARWRSSDRRHEAAIARLSATWATLQQLREFRPEAARHPDRDLLQAPRLPVRKRRSSMRVAWGVAAVAICFAFALILGLSPAKRSVAVVDEEHATTVDGYARVSLEDGSVVELNSNSQIVTRFTVAQRYVRLVKGEAHFVVAKDTARPFLVDTGAVAVRAVGTAFNIRLASNDVEVLVTEGKVALSESPSENASRLEVTDTAGSSPAPSHANLTTLIANERARIRFTRASAAGVKWMEPIVEKVSAAMVREALAWQGPRLIFVDTPLSEVILQFNRRNPIPIELADPELGRLPIGGSFRSEHVDAFVRLLSSGGEVTVDQSDPTRIVLRKSK